MNIIIYRKPWTDWTDTSDVWVDSVIMTDDGRGPSEGEMTCNGFKLDAISAGDFISVAGSPHVWTIETATYNAENNETSYTMTDAFCWALKRRVLLLDMYSTNSAIDGRISKILYMAEKALYPSLTGWDIRTYYKGRNDLTADADRQDDSYKAGENLLDVLYKIVEPSDYCLWIQTAVKNSTTLMASVVWRNTDYNGRVIDEASYKTEYNGQTERGFVIEGRNFDKAYNANQTDYTYADDLGEQSNLAGITKTLASPDEHDMQINGWDSWSRSALSITPSLVQTLLTFGGVLPVPSIAVFQKRLWVMGNCGQSAWNLHNAICIPCASDVIMPVLTREDIAVGNYNLYLGWNNAGIIRRTGGGAQTWGNAGVISTATQVAYSSSGFQTLDELGTGLTGSGRKLPVIMVCSFAESTENWFPLTGTADMDLETSFRILDPSVSSDKAILSAPMVYPLDLWRLVCGAMKSAENASAMSQTDVTSTIDLAELSDLNTAISSFSTDETKRLAVGSIITLNSGNRHRVDAITATMNEDGTKYDVETTQL